MKRRPPTGNVRRVVYSGQNIRSTYTNKAGRTVQCESYLEKVLCMSLDRDITVLDYLSQPEQISWIDASGRKHTYIPDYKVWRVDGSTELHEVTLTERQEQNNIVERERAARKECQKRGWRYVVHTEKTLPKATELANLEALHCYRAKTYASKEISALILERLSGGGFKLISQEVSFVAQQLNVSSATVLATLYHLIWHNVLSTDLSKLVLIEAPLNHQIFIWIS